LRGDQSLPEIVVPWLEPHEPGEVAFRALPGIFQEAFVQYWTGRDVPLSPTSLMWTPTYGQEGDAPNWLVRRFPPGATEEGPAIGELGIGFARRDWIMTMFDQRGW
jgi:hypothetical protein